LILIDSNIPMYLIGTPHPHKSASQQLLERCVVRGEKLVTDAEVLQEILHRYSAIDRREAIQPAFDVLLGLVEEVLEVGIEEVERAKRIVLGASSLSARDAIHVAVMNRHGIERIMSFDRGFDGHPGVERIFR